MNIQEIEQELITLAKQDQKTWVSFYKLMKQVQEQELYKETAHTFTQWVKNFSIKCGLHESSLWNRLKAGKVYESYQRMQEQKGIEAKPIEEIDISVDNLVLLDKINKKSEEVASDLVAKVLNKELTRQDLRETYKALGGDQRPSVIKAKKEAGEEVEKPLEHLITAAAIINSLSESNWLGAEIKNDRFTSSEQRNKYRTFTEFSVQTGTSRKSRRIDLLAVENISTSEWGVNIHGIEIKVAKSDLTRDTKYTEYANSVDYLWLAIPAELLNSALETKADNIGIIIIGADSKAIIHTPATRLEPLARENTLINIILKSI